MGSEGTSLTLRLFGRDVDASRALKKVGDQADKTSKKLDKTSGSLAGLGRIGVIGGLAASIAPAFNLASTALTMTAAAAALLPAALASAGAAFGVAALGAAYFGQALKDIRDPKKFAADLKGLSPAAKDAARSIRSLLPSLDNLRLNVQENLFQGTAKGIKQLAGQYLPTLRTRLTSIAAALNGAGRGMASFLGRPQQVRMVDQILASTAKTTVALGTALRPVVGAFLQLAQVGSQFLPGFATQLGAAAQHFADFVSSGAKSGQISALISNGAAAAGVLAGALLSVGRILTGIGAAAASSSSGGLGAIGGVLKTIADTVNSPAFQGGLTTVFAGLATGAQAVEAVLPQVAAALVAIAPAFASIASGVGGGLASVLSTTAQLIISLAPEINSLAATFAKLAPSLAPVLVAFLAVRRATGAFKAVSGAVKEARAVFMSLRVAVIAVRDAFALMGAMAEINPIFLIITAVALLAIGLYEAYQHSETFRIVVQTAFRAVASVVLQAVSILLLALQKLFEAAGHIPGIGHAMRGVAGSFATARQYIDGVSQSINRIPNHVGVAVDVAYNVSISGPAGILGAGKYGGYGQGLGFLAPQGGHKAVTIGHKVSAAPKISYNSGLGVGKGFGQGVGSGIKKTTDYTNNHFVKYAKNLEAKLLAATKKLADIMKARTAYIKQLRDSLIAATAITGFEKDPNRRGTPGADYYIKYLAGRLKALKSYTSNVAKLRKLGLNRTTLQQILDAGVEGGSDDAAALAAGGKRAIGQVNKIQKQIGKTAGGLATGVGNQFYKAGVAAAQGLVKGLQSSRKALLKVAQDLAKGLRKAIRKELKIHSPSRALHEDGRFAGLGFLGGVDSTRAAISKSLSGLARPTGSFPGGRSARGGDVHHHYELHAGVVVDSTNALREFDRMAKTAKSRGYRPHTLVLQGR